MVYCIVAFKNVKSENLIVGIFRGLKEFQKNNPSKTKMKNDYGSSKEGCSGIPLAFPGLAIRFVHLTKIMPCCFWEHLKTGKA